MWRTMRCHSMVGAFSSASTCRGEPARVPNRPAMESSSKSSSKVRLQDRIDTLGLGEVSGVAEQLGLVDGLDEAALLMALAVVLAVLMGVRRVYIRCMESKRQKERERDHRLCRPLPVQGALGGGDTSFLNDGNSGWQPAGDSAYSAEAWTGGLAAQRPSQMSWMTSSSSLRSYGKVAVDME
ncbi:hypothetical protein CYMTET_27291 [Cymbomonas tetramitiformis]|uniref:Uncharacterized protein n=1 Tax=Cymbomonas tetramitiformis TaxID=36881 RepID=A0AAE0FQK0_9CHLO|nr:hypothetical protein CYMTET_27291 [Cymbomonas tetramitiformis]